MAGKTSLNLATIEPATLEQKLHAARAAGFDAVGLLLDEMTQQGEGGVDEVRMSELPVSELVGLSGWMEPDRTDRLVGLAQAEQAAELAAGLGCPLLTALPAHTAVDPVAGAGRFGELCRLVAPFGIKVGFEFVGGSESVKDAAAAWEVVDLSEAENGGLVIDTFHFHLGGSELHMLDPVPGEKIFLVQVSDAVDLPRHELLDRHRVYPGTGIIPLEPLLAAVRDKGYSGYYSLELHNEEYWEEGPVVVAREGLRAMNRLDIL